MDIEILKEANRELYKLRNMRRILFELKDVIDSFIASFSSKLMSLEVLEKEILYRELSTHRSNAENLRDYVILKKNEIEEILDKIAL
jgi:hypothetical protein